MELSLWAKLASLQKENSSYYCRAEQMPAFPTVDYHCVKQNSEFEIRVACLGLTGRYSPYAETWQSISKRSSVWETWVLDLESSWYELHFQDWQHYHLSQSICRDWFEPYVKLSVNHAGSRHPQLSIPHESYTLPGFQSIDSFPLGRGLILSGNALLGSRVRVAGLRWLALVKGEPAIACFVNPHQYRELSKNLTLRVDLNIKGYSRLGQEQTGYWLGRRGESRINSPRYQYYWIFGASSIGLEIND